VLPEDENVPVSIAQHIPVLLLKSRSEFSNSVKSLARRASNRVGYEPDEDKVTGGGGFFGWLKRLFGISR
jgi:MinD-like ATPase involved in chromosome partitioning or flagellar assembly